jgi:hypothetical protein
LKKGQEVLPEEMVGRKTWPRARMQTNTHTIQLHWKKEVKTETPKTHTQIQATSFLQNWFLLEKVLKIQFCIFEYQK